MNKINTWAEAQIALQSGEHVSEFNPALATALQFVGIRVLFDEEGKFFLTKSNPIVEEAHNEYIPDEWMKNVAKAIIRKATPWGKVFLIWGEAGSGKTAFVAWLAKATGRNYFKFNCDSTTNAADIFGDVQIEGGKSFFKPSALMRAIISSTKTNPTTGEQEKTPDGKSGIVESQSCIILIDEVGMLTSGAFASLNDLLNVINDGGGWMNIGGARLWIPPSVIVIMTANISLLPDRNDGNSAKFTAQRLEADFSTYQRIEQVKHLDLNFGITRQINKNLFGQFPREWALLDSVINVAEQEYKKCLSGDGSMLNDEPSLTLSNRELVLMYHCFADFQEGGIRYAMSKWFNALSDEGKVAVKVVLDKSTLWNPLSDDEKRARK